MSLNGDKSVESSSGYYDPFASCFLFFVFFLISLFYSIGKSLFGSLQFVDNLKQFFRSDISPDQWN